MVVDTPEMIAVRHWRERAVEWKDFEAVTRKIELTNDLGPQQGDDVRADRIAEAWEDLFSDGGAAQDMPPLEDEDGFSGPGEIGSGGETVMTTANNNDVVAHGKS